MKKQLCWKKRKTFTFHSYFSSPCLSDRHKERKTIFVLFSFLVSLHDLARCPHFTYSHIHTQCVFLSLSQKCLDKRGKQHTSLLYLFSSSSFLDVWKRNFPLSLFVSVCIFVCILSFVIQHTDKHISLWHKRGARERDNWNFLPHTCTRIPRCCF